MKHKKSILFRIIIINSLITLVAILLVSRFTQSYIYTYTQEHEEQVVLATANHIANSLQEQLSFIISNTNQLKIEIIRDHLDPDTILKHIKKYMTVPAPFIYDIYYVDFIDNLMLSTIDHTLTADKVAALTDLQGTNTMDSHFSLETTSYSPLAYTLINPVENTTDDSGLLCIDVDLEAMNTFVNSLNYNKNISVLIINEHNQIIISDIKTNHTTYMELYDELMAHSRSNEISTDIATTNNGHYYAHSVKLSNLDWKLIAFSNNDLIASETNRLPLYIVAFNVIFLLLMFGATTLQWSQITYSLNKIIQQIEKIRNNKFGAKVSKVSISELIPIVDAFNDMSDELETTINKKLDAERDKQFYEYKALLAQVNPHFLYNSLNSINALLDLKRYEDIRCVNSTIISLLSFSIAKNGQIIKIGEEIELIRQYVEMQKIRYNNRFSLTVAMPPEILDKNILHMSMIPLIENAIFHGFPNKDTSNGLIHITGYVATGENAVIITITDNGVGIPKAIVEQLLIKDDVEDRSLKGNRYVSIGLKNVHERLVLSYGDQYGLNIFSDYGSGTTIEIRIPNHDNTDKEVSNERD